MSDALPKAWRYRVLAATRDLIIACGGAERCAQVVGIHPGSVYRWQHGKDMIPLLSAMVLEQDCGRPYVTEIMAAYAGRQLTDDPETGEPTRRDVDLAHNALMREHVELTSSVLDATADRIVTPAEAEVIDRKAADVGRAVDDLRETLAERKAGSVHVLPKRSV